MSNAPGPSAELISAHTLRLHGCDTCGLVSRVDSPNAGGWHCPRCHAPLYRNAVLGLQRVTAYLIAAAVLYIPANVLPVMTTSSVWQGTQSHTILGGIAELWEADEWELALIVFVASIAVPLLKMVALLLLVVTARRGSRWRQAERTRLYRMVEAVGHWSMLDVLVVVLLVAMVRFEPLANVQPEPGLLAFGAVVVLTMLASQNFDPRLIWNPRVEVDD
ncbi:MAG TPA: paraquat-inducible protein A [Burkholderiaceae bacterium]|nr:paraquat-inducible protein A [Burkholderiaceae bacterium]